MVQFWCGGGLNWQASVAQLQFVLFVIFKDLENGQQPQLEASGKGQATFCDHYYVLYN